MMQLSLMTLMLTAIGLSVQAEQACDDGTCPPKVNSLLQIGGRSTDVSQVDPATATTTFQLADKITVNKQCTSKGLLGLYNFNKNADISSNNGLDVKDISALVNKKTNKLKAGAVLKFDLHCNNTKNCLKIFEWCQRNNKRGITINFNCRADGADWINGSNPISVVLDDRFLPSLYVSPNHIDWRSMYRLELYSGPYASKKTSRDKKQTNFTLENVRLEFLTEDELLPLVGAGLACAEKSVVSADDFVDEAGATLDDVMNQECADHDQQTMCSAGGCVWDATKTVPDCVSACGGTEVADCAGVCGGTAEADCAGVCGGTEVADCAGVCGGTATCAPDQATPGTITSGENLCSVQLNFYTDARRCECNHSVQPRLGETLDGTNGFTMAAWVYRYSNVSEWDSVFWSVPEGSTWHAGVSIGFRQGFRHYHVGTGGEMDVNEVFPDNVWTHYAVVHEIPDPGAKYGVATIYWNGTKMSEAKLNRPRKHPSGSKYGIGDFDGGWRTTPGGSLKDIFVFNQALTIDELMTLKDERRLPDGKMPVITAGVTNCQA